MEELEREARWFMQTIGKKGFPFIRFYLRATIQEALKTHSKDEVQNLLKQVGADYNADTEGWV